MGITMLLTALVVDLAYATEDSQFVNLPWGMSLIKVDSDCPQLCGNWSALFLSESGCKGTDMLLLDDGDTFAGKEVVVGETLRFCPDKDVVEVWTLEQESIYVAMHLRKDALLKPEREMFRRMTYEREMKLSVHPWQMFSAQEINELRQTRRLKGSETKFKCRGLKEGTKRKKAKGEKPSKVTTEFENGVLNFLKLKYPQGNGIVKTGTLIASADATEDTQRLPDCVQVVFLQSNGRQGQINSLQFLSQGKETRFFGTDENDSYVFIAPSGKCLADTKLRGDAIVNRFCMKFNGSEE